MDRFLARFALLAAGAALTLGTALAGELPRVQGEYAWAKSRQAPAALLLDKATSAVDTFDLSALDASLIGDAQRANRSAAVKAVKIGINRAMSEGAGARNWVPDLQWQGAKGKRATQLRIASPDAAALRVALAFKNVPEGIELRVTGRDGEPVIGPLSAANLRTQLDVDGRYWSPVTEGDVQWIEIALPAGTDGVALGLSVEGVSHLFTSISDRFKLAKGIGDSAPCEIDLACVVNPSAALLAASRSVARMNFTTSAGTFLCTGTLMNDADTGSQVPYFMTANHCISKQSEAGTLNTYWFYDAVSCDSLATPPFTQLAAGATLLVNRPELDSTLLNLLNTAPSGSFFSGYDANLIAQGTAFTIVHHPNGDLKKVSQGLVTGFSAAGEVPNLSTGFIVVGYNVASTEGGSSGGALLTLANGQLLLRGTLYGGAASCTNVGDFSGGTNNYDYFSRFDQFYHYVKSYVGPIALAQSVEFYNSTLNHYFMTSENGEITYIEGGGAGPGWSRTGFAFNVLTAITSAYSTSAPACRFYGTPGVGPNSHFYTASAGECNQVKASPGWTYEGLNFASINPSAGNCPAGTSPVYRTYNNRFPQNDSNHRYSTSLATLQSMAGAGWVFEGVVLCAPN